MTKATLLLGLSLLTCPVAAIAQQPVGFAAADKYVISARAGGVNYAKGTVTVLRADGRSGSILKGDSIEIGDRLMTGDDGRVELLMNPGSFLRMASSSSLEFATTSLDDLQIKLHSGSAMFEVFATNEFKVTVLTPKGSATLVDSGIYRVDVSANGTGNVSVYEGRAMANGTIKVKGGRTSPLDPTSAAVSKFDKSKLDDLGEWSRTRGKDLAKLTESLTSSNFRNALLGSYFLGEWNTFGSFGLWVFSPFGHTYCFLPFGRGWYSPYGYRYHYGIQDYGIVPQTIRPIQPPLPGPVDPAERKTTDGGPRTNTAPFTAIERTRGGRRWEPVDAGNGGGAGSQQSGTGIKRIDYPTADDRGRFGGGPPVQSAPQPTRSLDPMPTVRRGGKESPIDN